MLYVFEKIFKNPNLPKTQHFLKNIVFLNIVRDYWLGRIFAEEYFLQHSGFSLKCVSLKIRPCCTTQKS